MLFDTFRFSFVSSQGFSKRGNPNVLKLNLPVWFQKRICKWCMSMSWLQKLTQPLAGDLRKFNSKQIGVHWRHYRKSQSDSRVFSNRRPFQILRSMLCLIFNICTAYAYLLWYAPEESVNGRSMNILICKLLKIRCYSLWVRDFPFHCFIFIWKKIQLEV
jgi:hypothetical protein